MGGTGTLSMLLGVGSIISLLVGGIMLLGLIQRAFEREGVLWGIISIFYPPGTYLYCRKNWDIYRKNFVLISSLLLASFCLWLVVRFMV